MKKFTKAGAKFAAAAAVSVMALGYTTSVWAEENTVEDIGKEFAGKTVSLPSIYFSSEKADNVKGIGLDIHNVEKLNIINKDEGRLDICSRAISNKNAVGIGINVNGAQANFDINGYFGVLAQGVIKGTEANVSMRAVGFSGKNGSSRIKADYVAYEASNHDYREAHTGTLVEESLGMALNNYAMNIFAEEDINIDSFIFNNTELTGEKTAQGMVLSNESKASLQADGRISIEAFIYGSTSNSKLEAINASCSKLDMKAEQGIKIAAANGDAIVADNQSEITLDSGSSVIDIRGNVNVSNNSVLKLSRKREIDDIGIAIAINGNVNVSNNSTLKLSGVTSVVSGIMRAATSVGNLNVDNSKLVVDGFTGISGTTTFENAKIYLYDDNNTSEDFHALLISNLDMPGNNELFLRADSSKPAGDITRLELNSDVLIIMSREMTGDGKFDVNIFDKGMKNGYGMSADGTKGLDNPITVLYNSNPGTNPDFASLINSVKMNYDNGIWSYDMNAKLDDSDKKKIVIKEVTVEAAPSASGSQRSLHSANKAAGALAIGVLGNDNALHAHLREAQGAGEREEVWAQYLGGKLKSDGMQLKHNGVELGYDAYVGNNWTFGVSGMQTRGNTQLDSGSGKAKTNVGTVYGAWHGGSSYLNLEAKAGRVSSESKTFGGTVLQKIAGEFSAPAYSVSAEYGSTHELPAAWYLEPAVRLSYVHLGAADYGVQVKDTLARVANDSLDSFILRGGAKLGRRLGAKGSFYVKAAAVYDFGGDLATTVSADGRTAHYEDSLGGWGVEYGAGLEYKLGRAANISLDVERRSGGELKRDWGVNIGVNYSF